MVIWKHSMTSGNWMTACSKVVKLAEVWSLSMTCAKVISPFWFFSVWYGYDTTNVTLFFEAASSSMDGGDGFVKLSGYFFVGYGAICLQEA
jgi:hypothetical protein